MNLTLKRPNTAQGLITTIALFATAAVVSLSGCATPSTTSGSAPTTAAAYRGVLTYPERMKPVGADGYAREWIDPATDFARYKRIAIERIRIQLDAQSSSVDPGELKVLTDYFQQALKKSLEPTYPLANEVGSDVLRVRITLVDLVATKPEVSLAVLVIPYASVPDLAIGAASGGPQGSAPYLGRTGIAVAFIDGGSNAVVGEFVDENFGRKFVLDASDASKTVSGTVDGYTKSFSTWAYAQQAFDGWAQLFRQRLDAANERKRT
jgi:hypothetical protein